MSTITETVVENAALEWLGYLGWQTAHAPEIGPDSTGAERDDYDQVVFVGRLRDALQRLNPQLPAGALDDAYRRLTRPQGSTMVVRNAAFRRMLVDGVSVEYQTPDGSTRGAQAQVIDFGNPANNDWLAVNQFTVTENHNNRRPDIVLFVNGLPLGVIELKNPVDPDATIRDAWQQLRT